MSEAMVIDGESRNEIGMEKKPSAKRQKVKTSTDAMAMTPDEREAKISALNEELQNLFKYFKEVVSENRAILDSHYANCCSSNFNSVIALLLEEKSASYSRLASEIYEKAKERESTVTIASVKSSILYVGQRSSYGVPNGESDVLEDETESCLWCWETRDMKLLPKSVCGDLKVRRTCRKKIGERISAINAMLLLLQNPTDGQNHRNDFKKTSEKLSKVLDEANIRLLVESLTQKNGSVWTDKEANREGKLLAKQLEKKRQEEEKEKKKKDRELQKEKLQREKEMKRLQEEAEKEEKRREREDSEMRKQLKRKQEDLERDQRRREKEETEQKKKRSLQKQASIMERFLHKNKNDSPSQCAQTENDAIPSDQSSKQETFHESVTILMDSALLQKEQINIEEMRKLHLNAWRHLGQSVRSRSGQHWGLRYRPKTALVKEIKLSSSKGSKQEEELSTDVEVSGWGEQALVKEIRLSSSKGSKQEEEVSTDAEVSGWGEQALGDEACNADNNFVIQKCRRSKKLLQFDKSYRPAFYGVWPKQSHTVGPRNPFKKDPELDYDVDSDEEWEEEEPGESLSECEKDEEETLEEGFSKADEEDESEDGFFVPDGYLSENEGVHIDGSPCTLEKDGDQTSPSTKPEAESEEFSSWFRQLKHLHNLTNRALLKNQPLLITNLMHEKAHFLCSDNLAGTSKVEQIFLQSLAMRSLPGGSAVEVHSDEILKREDQEAGMSTSKSKSLLAGSVTGIPDSEFPKFVATIESCPYGMNKVLESLLQNFPSCSKSQLRNNVRQISDFVDNKWQVKKEILDKLGLSKSPERKGAKTKSIATFFSKRCMPPSGNIADPAKASPESSQKTMGSQQQQTAEVQINQVPL